MGSILETIGGFCNTVLGALKTAFPIVFGVPGLVVVACSTFGTTVYALFQDWSIGSSLTRFIGYATSAIEVLSGAVEIHSPIAQNILSFTACDSLASYFVAALTATIGVTVFAFASILVATIPLLSAVLVVRLTLKLVRICSAGIVDP